MCQSTVRSQHRAHADPGLSPAAAEPRQTQRRICPLPLHFFPLCPCALCTHQRPLRSGRCGTNPWGWPVHLYRMVMRRSFQKLCTRRGSRDETRPRVLTNPPVLAAAMHASHPLSAGRTAPHLTFTSPPLRKCTCVSLALSLALFSCCLQSEFSQGNTEPITARVHRRPHCPAPILAPGSWLLAGSAVMAASNPQLAPPFILACSTCTCTISLFSSPSLQC